MFVRDAADPPRFKLAEQRLRGLTGRLPERNSLASIQQLLLVVVLLFKSLNSIVVVLVVLVLVVLVVGRGKQLAGLTGDN